VNEAFAITEAASLAISEVPILQQIEYVAYASNRRSPRLTGLMWCKSLGFRQAGGASALLPQRQ